MAPSTTASFPRLVWSVLAYTVAVILFGAVVRITGSGAGCGQHWPTCQGEVVHLPRSAATAIELTHRVTSGLSLVLVVVLGVLALRRFPKGHSARRAAAASVAFMLSEALIGAALVLLELVGRNSSVSRAFVMGLHLVNTSFLTAALALTAFTAARPAPRPWRPICPLEWSLLGALAAILVVSVTGGVTALGDTLYPLAGGSLAEHVARDHAPAASFFERGRAVHPLVAAAAAAFVLTTSLKTRVIRPLPEVVRAADLVSVLVVAQVVAGATNVWLSAPAYMQVLHLALATALFIALVLLYATALAARRDREADLQQSARGPAADPRAQAG